MNALFGMVERFFRLFIWWITVAPWEEAVRVRAGKHVSVLGAGIHFRIPVIDRIYLQTTRRRVTSMPVQTLTTRDGKTVTLAAVLGYQITDLLLLYQTLHHAEDTVRNLALAAIAAYVQGHTVVECLPESIQAYVTENIGLDQFGLGAGQVHLVMFCMARTHRLIMDSQWGTNGQALDTASPLQGSTPA